MSDFRFFFCFFFWTKFSGQVLCFMKLACSRRLLTFKSFFCLCKPLSYEPISETMRRRAKRNAFSGLTRRSLDTDAPQGVAWDYFWDRPPCWVRWSFLKKITAVYPASSKVPFLVNLEPPNIFFWEGQVMLPLGLQFETFLFSQLIILIF